MICTCVPSVTVNGRQRPVYDSTRCGLRSLCRRPRKRRWLPSSEESASPFAETPRANRPVLQRTKRTRRINRFSRREKRPVAFERHTRDQLQQGAKPSTRRASLLSPRWCELTLRPSGNTATLSKMNPHQPAPNTYPPVINKRSDINQHTTCTGILRTRRGSQAGP